MGNIGFVFIMNTYVQSFIYNDYNSNLFWDMLKIIYIKIRCYTLFKLNNEWQQIHPIVEFLKNRHYKTRVFNKKLACKI